MKEMIISWTGTEGKDLQYFVDKKPVGNGDEGFEKILAILKKDRQAAWVVIKVDAITALGGQSAEETLPFGNRYDEFTKAVGTRSLITRYF